MPKHNTQKTRPLTYSVDHRHRRQRSADSRENKTVLSMADFSSPSALVEVLSDLNNRVSCHVCLENFTDPRMLPCQHVFLEVARAHNKWKMVGINLSIAQDRLSSIEGQYYSNEERYLEVFQQWSNNNSLINLR